MTLGQRAVATLLYWHQMNLLTKERRDNLAALIAALIDDSPPNLHGDPCVCAYCEKRRAIEKELG